MLSIKQYLILLSVLFIGSALAHGTAASYCTTGNYTLCTDQDDYTPESTVHITGSGFAPDAALTIKVIRPSGPVVTGNDPYALWPTPYDTIMTDASGSFGFDYLLDGVTGDYTIVVLRDGTAIATHLFKDAPKIACLPSPSNVGTSTACTVSGIGSSNRAAHINWYNSAATLIFSDACDLGTCVSTHAPSATGIWSIKLVKDSDGVAQAEAPLAVNADNTPPVISGMPADKTIEAASSSGAAVTYTTPTANDAVDGSVPVSCLPASGSTFAIGTATVTCTASDSHSNTATLTFHITVQDTTAPVISAHEDLTQEATSSTGASVSYTPAATTDLVDGAGTASCVPASGSLFSLGVTKVVCSAVDNHGNHAADTSFNIDVVDTTSPVIDAHADISAEASGPSGAIVAYEPPLSHDQVDGAIDSQCLPGSGSLFGLGQTEVTCTRTDAHGNVAAPVSFRIAVQDTTAPVIDAVPSMTAEATSPSGAAVTFTLPLSHDAVDGDQPSECDHSSGAFPLGITVVTCGVTDTAGNTAASVQFTVTVKDTAPPLISGTPSDMTVEASSSDGAAITYALPSAADLVDGDVPVNCIPSSGSTLSIGETNVDCIAADAASNSAHASFTITVVDTTSPVIDAHADVFAEAAGASGAIVDYAVPATHDIVDGDKPASCSPMPGTLFALGMTDITCTKTDAHGNVAAPVSFRIAVQDTTAPVIDSHEDIVAEATSSSGAFISYSAPSSHDAVDGEAMATCLPASGSEFSLGDTQITCTRTDTHGNAAGPVAFKVTVQDTLPPDLTVSPDVTAEAAGPAGAAVSYSAPYATDAVGVTELYCDPAAGMFAIGTNEVACHAKDAAGHDTIKTFKVTVQDTSAPVVAVPTDILLEATGALTPVVFSPLPSAADLVDGLLPVVCSRESGSAFAVGEMSVLCTSTDAHGNTGSASFKVTVQDTSAPVVAVPSDITQEATGPSGVEVSFASAAFDLVDGSLATECTPASGTVFALGLAEVTCTSTDAHGNTGSASFNVNVVDTTAPEIAAPDVAMEATGPKTGVSFSPTASDMVDGPVAVTCTPSSGSLFPVGESTVACIAADEHGNTGSIAFKVTITDTTPPVIDPHDLMIEEATSPSGASVNYGSPSAHDLVDGDIMADCTPISGSMFAIGDTLITCTASDSHSNPAEPVTFTVRVQDTTAPLTSDDAPSGWHKVPVDVTLSCVDSGSGCSKVYYTTDGSLPTQSSAFVDQASSWRFTLSADGNYLLKYMGQDISGNLEAVRTADNQVMIDQTPPIITYTGRTSANAKGWNNGDVTVGWACSDALSGAVSDTASVTLSAEGAAQEAYGECRDNAGNAAGDEQTGINIDKTMPALSPSFSPVPLLLNGIGTPSHNAEDGLSGIDIATCPPLDTAAVGLHTVTCTAADNAGNMNSAVLTYQVNYASGQACMGSPGHQVLEPVNADGSSVFKQKSTVPVKFRVCDASGSSVSTPGVVTSFKLVGSGFDLASLLATPETVDSSTPDTAFRWSADSRQWIFNLNTKSLKQYWQYKYQITLDDGSKIDFAFRLK